MWSFCSMWCFFKALSLHEVVLKTMSLHEDIYLLEVLFLYENHIHLCASFTNDNNFVVLHMIILFYFLFCILCCFSWIMKDCHILMDIEDYSTIAIRFCFIDLVIANSVFSNWYASFFRFIAKFDQCNQHLGCHYISVHIIIALFAAWGVVCKPQSLDEG
jgi:hypothetical protein